MNFAAPVTLHGWGITLVPLDVSHVQGLQAAVADGDIGALRYITTPRPDGMAEFLQSALALRDTGTQQPFVVMVQERLVGTTRFYDIERSVPNCAIGYTFYAASMQRTHVNTACKRLLLGYAFDALGMQAVYFHTSHENLRSRAAIERLGARRDGVIRNHKRHKDGSLRDTCTYSIIVDEWPAIRAALEAKLANVAR